MSDPTLPRLDAVTRGHRLADLELEQVRARMAQLEKVAELTRPVVANLTTGAPIDDPHHVWLLELAITELDNHPDTREPTTTENPR